MTLKKQIPGCNLNCWWHLHGKGGDHAAFWDGKPRTVSSLMMFFWRSFNMSLHRFPKVRSLRLLCHALPYTTCVYINLSHSQPKNGTSLNLQMSYSAQSISYPIYIGRNYQ